MRDGAWSTVPATHTSGDLTYKGCLLLNRFFIDKMLEELEDDEEREMKYRQNISEIKSKQGNKYYAVRQKTQTMIWDETQKKQCEKVIQPE